MESTTEAPFGAIGRDFPPKKQRLHRHGKVKDKTKIMFNTMIARRDRTRIEKLGSGLGNYTGLFLKFGFAATWLIGGRRSSHLYLSVVHFGRFLLSWKGRAPSLVKYLKGCQILLMQAVSGNPESDSRLLGVVVSRGYLGIPRVIPHRDRIRIARGDVPLIRLWLSLLGCYRLIEYRGKASYKTITQPGKDISQPLAAFLLYLTTRTEGSLEKKLLKRIPVKLLEFKPLAILTSGPNVPPNTGAIWTLAWDAWKIWSVRKSAWYKALEDYCLLTQNTKFLGLIGEYAAFANQSRSIPKDELSATVTKGKTLWERSLIHLVSRTRVEDSDGATRTSSHVLSFQTWKSGLRLARLHAIPEPAGKVRIVAMVTWWIQCLLYPIHASIFKRLAFIPQDGTGNQGKPLEALCLEIKRRLSSEGHAHVYSYDLKAATDRIPIELQMRILSIFLRPNLAKAWVKMLVGVPFSISSLKMRFGKGGDSVRYAVGQPMGAYSSWAMLALTHHFLVQFSAYKAGYNGWYPFYAVLGDDVVILGKGVAKRYLETCEDFGITIGLAKSLISSNGSFEFAKRFYYRGENASPLSAREYWVALGSLSAFVELVQRAKAINPTIRLSDAIRAYSKGYRAVGSLNKSLASLGNTRLANYLAALFLPGAPFAKSLKAIFSPTSTAVRLDENLVDTPITEQRVKSISRSIGQAISEYAGSHLKAQKTFFSEFSARGHELVRGRSPRLVGALLDVGIAPFIGFERALKITDRAREINVLESFGLYLQKGNLNSRGLITLLEKILPIWTHSMSDVGALPVPEGLIPAMGVLQRPKLHRYLKVRVRLLGLPWKNRPSGVSKGRKSKANKIQRSLRTSEA